jgi:hypothetical protein
MNHELYNQLLKQFQNTATVTSYNRSFEWVNNHLIRLCEEFDFLGVGLPVKHTISDVTRVSKIQRFIVGENGVLVNTGFGNVWYYETKKPSVAETKKFDGHCLVIK